MCFTHSKFSANARRNDGGIPRRFFLSRMDLRVTSVSQCKGLDMFVFPFGCASDSNIILRDKLRDDSDLSQKCLSVEEFLTASFLQTQNGYPSTCSTYLQNSWVTIFLFLTVHCTMIHYKFFDSNHFCAFIILFCILSKQFCDNSIVLFILFVIFC